MMGRTRFNAGRAEEGAARVPIGISLQFNTLHLKVLRLAGLTTFNGHCPAQSFPSNTDESQMAEEKFCSSAQLSCI